MADEKKNEGSPWEPVIWIVATIAALALLAWYRGTLPSDTQGWLTAPSYSAPQPAPSTNNSNASNQ